MQSFRNPQNLRTFLESFSFLTSVSPPIANLYNIIRIFLFINTFVTILLLNVCICFRVNTYHCNTHKWAYICGMIEI